MSDSVRVIRLKEAVKETGSSESGMVLFSILEELYLAGIDVVLKIDINTSVSASFMNGSFGEFMDKYSVDVFKSNVKIQSNSLQFNRIAKYIEDFEDQCGVIKPFSTPT